MITRPTVLAVVVHRPRTAIQLLRLIHSEPTDLLTEAIHCQGQLVKVSSGSIERLSPIAQIHDVIQRWYCSEGPVGRNRELVYDCGRPSFIRLNACPRGHERMRPGGRDSIPSARIVSAICTRPLSWSIDGSGGSTFTRTFFATVGPLLPTTTFRSIPERHRGVCRPIRMAGLRRCAAALGSSSVSRQPWPREKLPA
jgi:hypothetical protein